MAIREHAACTGAPGGCGRAGGPWARNRAHTSAKSCPITAAGSTASRFVRAGRLTRTGVTHNTPSRASTRCTSVTAGIRRQTRLTTMATITGRGRSRGRMRMTRGGGRGSRRSIWRGASKDGRRRATSGCARSSPAGLGICERCRHSAWGRGLEGSVAKFDFGAKSQTQVSRIQ